LKGTGDFIPKPCMIEAKKFSQRAKKASTVVAGKNLPTVPKNWGR